MVNVTSVALLPLASVAEQVMVLTPTGNLVPDTFTQVTTTAGSAASEAVGSGYVTSAPRGEVASTHGTFGGLAMTGGVRSHTRIVKEVEAELPSASLALHTTVLVPREKVEPDGGTQLTVTAPLTTSNADGRL
jgi:hypothetical protein